MRFLLFVMLLGGCVKGSPPSDLNASADAGPTADAKLDAIEHEVAAVVEVIDEALWKHWTAGAALDLAAATQGHDALLSRATLDLLREARVRRQDDRPRIDALTRWLGGEVLARKVAPESEVVANLEATATFSVDGKEFPFRDLGKLLAQEKSAVKRRALWTASFEPALRIDAAIAQRDAKLSETLTALGFPGPLEFAAASRALDLAALKARADHVLTTTEAAWQATLTALSEVEMKLPNTALTRADLPRLFKIPAAVDAEFPKAKIAARAVQTLGTLGAYGQAGLTLDLAEAAQKSPLPLTVAPRPQDVRVSVRPLGGLKDQQLVLGELGAALALHHLRNEPFAVARLGNPAYAQSVSELLSTLTSENGWLKANAITHPEAVKSAADAQRLLTLRRAAGIVLARMETATMADADQARASFVAVMGRAMGVSMPPEEGARWRLETDDFLRSATLLEAMAKAELWRSQWGEGWWLKPLALPSP
jgi:hypothetical protein